MKQFRTKLVFAALGAITLLGSCTPHSSSTSIESRSRVGMGDDLPLAGLDVSGRYKGKAGDNNAGLILTRLSDQSYLSIVIVYTKLLRDQPLKNIRQGIDRVVNSISLYRAAVTETSSSTRTLKLTFEPLLMRSGTLTSNRNPALHRTLTIVPKTPNQGIGAVLDFLSRNKSNWTASLSAPGDGSKAAITFDTFLEKSKNPTSTWDRYFVSNTWEDAYVLAQTSAKTELSTSGEQLLKLDEPTTYRGSYSMKEASYTLPGSSPVTIKGLYSLNTSTEPNALQDHLGIFIDVVNQKPTFSTRELFLINDASAQPHSPENPKGFIMYFEKDRI